MDTLQRWMFHSVFWVLQFCIFENCFKEASIETGRRLPEGFGLRMVLR